MLAISFFVLHIPADAWFLGLTFFMGVGLGWSSMFVACFPHIPPSQVFSLQMLIIFVSSMFAFMVLILFLHPHPMNLPLTNAMW